MCDLPESSTRDQINASTRCKKLMILEAESIKSILFILNKIKSYTVMTYNEPLKKE